MTAAINERRHDALLENRLIEQYGNLDGVDLLSVMIKKEFKGSIVATSSFGVEAAVLLDMVAEVDPSTPVVFLDTGLLFKETLAYRDALVERLKLTGVRTVGPKPEDIAAFDADGSLHLKDANACCRIRKVQPLESAIEGFDAWITGRKRFHGGERASLGVIERVDGHIKINPLVNWPQQRIDEAFEKRNLPRHPLTAEGYASVGCFPCTSKTESSEDARSGRWRHLEKTECGIHKAPWFGQGI